MVDQTLPEDWTILRGWLPEDLDNRARLHGFIQRTRGLTNSECWLRLILMHVAGGLSLEQTVVRARELGLAQISGIALFKRLRKAGAWLQDLCQYLLSEQQMRLGECAWPGEYRVRVIDATDVQEPGNTGSYLRVHYGIRLPELVCDHYELTNEKGGEKLGRFQFAENELILADRGYSHRAGAAKVLESGAALLLRWNVAVLPVKAEGGAEFDLLGKLRALPVASAGEWNVQFEYEGKIYPLRLCALRKSQLAAEKARRKSLRKSKRSGTKAQPESLERNEYILVLTSLPPKFSSSQVLELYRCRWQIELAFKRLKSLLNAGHLPKRGDESACPWMQAKILTALLLERLLLEANVFSPWGYRLQRIESLAAGARST